MLDSWGLFPFFILTFERVIVFFPPPTSSSPDLALLNLAVEATEKVNLEKKVKTMEERGAPARVPKGEGWGRKGRQYCYQEG